MKFSHPQADVFVPDAETAPREALARVTHLGVGAHQDDLEIMAYAGICGADNLQAHSDPYFHSKSLEEINTWIEGNGGSCTVDTPSDDAPPVIDTASLPPEVTIPMHTAFAMTGSATAAQRLLALDPADVAALTFRLAELCERTAAEAAAGPADLSDPLLDTLAQRHAERDRPLFVS